MSSVRAPQKTKRYLWLLPLLLLLLLPGVWVVTTHLLSKSADNKAQQKNSPGADLHVSLDTPKPVGGRVGAEFPPREKVIFTYDSITINGKTRSLVAKRRDSKYIPNTDAPSGFDLWIVDENGHERLVDSSVYRARFSPDGSKIAYGTSDAALRVEDLQGNKITEVDGGYDPNWSPDGKSVILAKVPPGRPKIVPGAFEVATVDTATGQLTPLTDGRFDDARPEFDPSGKNVLFVSGGRSGLASFWMIHNPGDPPVQITNLGAETVDDKFVPTPYSPHTLWSKDGEWFIYDYKRGDVSQTWGLKFDGTGNVQPMKLADGTEPHWKIEGQTFVCQASDGKMIEARLP